MIDSAAAVWSVPEPERAGRPLAILLHGRYGTEQDLVPFFAALPSQVVAVSLRGPVPWGDKWAWTPEWTGDPAPVHAVTTDLLTWIDTLTGFDGVGLIGFSQGGATALQLLRTAPRRFRYAVQLCGFTAPELDQADTELFAVRPPVLNIRCGRDTAIPVDLADYTTDWLRARTTLTEQHFPDLDHRITGELVTATAQYVARQLAT